MEPIADTLAEQSVLGSMLMSKEAVEDVPDMIGGEDFYHPKHASVYAAIQAVARRGDPVDALTVASELQTGGELARIGGAPYLHDLLAVTPSAANVGYYARIVRDKAIQRRVVDAATRITQLAASGEHDPDELVETARAEIDATSRATAEITSIAELIDPLLDAIANGEAAQIVSPTPWDELTHHTGGFRRGAVYVIGARPGVGKTIAGIQIALELAKTGFMSFHSLEMGENEIAARLIANRARVALGRLNGSGEPASERDWKLISENREEIDRLSRRIQIDDRSTVSPVDIRSFARSAMRAAERAGEPFNGLVVDYLQLMTAPSTIGSDTKRHEVVGHFSRSLKILARELNVPVILLSQLNRSSVGQDRPPTMADLRESGSIEQDADVILLLHHANPVTTDIDMLLEKNRHGMAPVPIELQRRGEYSALETRPWVPAHVA